MMADMTPADFAALSGGAGIGNNSWLWIIVLFFIFAMNGNGFGFGNSAATNQITNDFLYTNLSNQLGRSSDRIENVLNTGFTAVAQQGFQIDKDILSQTNSINQSLCQGFNGVNANITDVGYKMQDCCCQLKTAIHAEGEATRALITENEVQRLRTDLQSAQLTLANANQTQNILSSLGSYRPYGYSCGCGCNGIYA